MVPSSSELPQEILGSPPTPLLPHLNIHQMPHAVDLFLVSLALHFIVLLQVLNTFCLNHQPPTQLLSPSFLSLNPSYAATGLLFLGYTSDHESVHKYPLLYRALSKVILMTFL